VRAAAAALMAKTCAFCARGGVTREHVFGQWIAPLILLPGAITEAILGRLDAAWGWTTDALDLTVRT